MTNATHTEDDADEFESFGLLLDDTRPLGAFYDASTSKIERITELHPHEFAVALLLINRLSATSVAVDGSITLLHSDALAALPALRLGQTICELALITEYAGGEFELSRVRSELTTFIRVIEDTTATVAQVSDALGAASYAFGAVILALENLGCCALEGWPEGTPAPPPTAPAN